MTSFLSTSCCNGRRPRRFMGVTIRSRPDLVSRLMRERQVARFLVAPPGYGKTYLALEYAQVVFGFEHVAWIDARSPCFLRDLDGGSLGEDLMKRDKGMRLVVFDDVPRLGTQRADLLSHTFDKLLEVGSEVMVLCHPTSDAFAGRQIDRICLTARDLMLDAGERDEALRDQGQQWEEDEGEWEVVPTGAMLACYIPQLAWGPADAPARFAESLAREELPEEALCVHFVLLAMGEAPTSWLCGEFDLSPSQIEPFERDYPHLGIAPESDSVATVVFPPECLVYAYASRLKHIGASLGFETKDALACGVAKALLDRGDARRAVAMVMAMMGRAARFAWLLDNGRRLSHMLCLFPAWRLGKSLGKIGADAPGSRLEAQQAWRLGFLGDVRVGLLLAGKVAARINAPLDARVNALAMVAHFGNDVLRAGALERLSKLVSGIECVREGKVVRELNPEMALAFCLVKRFEVEVAPGTESAPPSLAASKLRRVWLDVAAACIDLDVVLFGGVLLLGVCPALAEDEMFCRLLVEGEEDGPIGVYRLEAYRALGDLARDVDAASEVASRLLTESVRSQTRHGERCIAKQQQEYGALQRSQEKARANRMPYAKPIEEGSLGEMHKPHLQISLFGGMEAVLDGRRLDANEFTQTKMRALLAILTMAGGREVSRNRLVEALWPASTERTAQKNLYTNWAALKRTLSMPDGSCPFLHHVQGSYRIDGRLVTSDVQQVTAVCRALAIEKPDVDRFRVLLEDLHRLYRGDLLPSEVKCDVIVDARDDYRSQVSDALVQATFRLLDMGEDQTALWFARSALEHERRQEDPYYALMSAQVACGQREAALETYRVCARALMRAFNIDPSPRMLALYRKITETEERF